MNALRRIVVIVLLVLAFGSLASAQSVIRMASYINAGATFESLQSIADAFNATHSDIKLEIEVYPQNEYIDKIYTMIMAGTPPDIFQVWAQYKPVWTENGFVLDLTDRWHASEPIRDAGIYPFVLESAQANGRIYGVPYDFNAQVVYYNRDWFAMRGVHEPTENWTVDDHAELARKLTDPQQGVYGTLNPVKTGRFESIQWMQNWSGHGWLNEAGTDVMVDHPDNLQMIQYWSDLERQYEAAPYPGSFAIRGNRIGGGYAMWTGWVSNAFTFTDPPAYDWAWALYPKGPAGQQNFAQTHMFSISSATPHADAAWQVIEWMASAEGQLAIVSGAELHPIGANPDLWDAYFASFPPQKAQEMHRWLANVLYGKNYASSFEYWDTYGEMEPIMQLHMANIFNRERPVNSEMAEAARKMRAILDSHN